MKCFGQKFKVFRKNLKCKFVGEWRVFTGNMKRFSWDNGRFSLENNCFQWDNSHILMTWWEHLCVQLDLSLFKPVWFYVKIKVLMGKCKAFLGEYMFWWVYTDRIWWGPLTEHHDASKMIYICIHCITSVYNTRMYIYIYIIYIYINIVIFIVYHHNFPSSLHCKSLFCTKIRQLWECISFKYTIFYHWPISSKYTIMIYSILKVS